MYGVCEACGARVLVREHRMSWGLYAFPGVDCPASEADGSHRVPMTGDVSEG